MGRILSFSIIIILASACDIDQGNIRPDDFGAPFTKISVTPQVADSTTWFVLSGSGSHDAQKYEGILDFRWDLDNNGSWDTPYTDQQTLVHVFAEPGIHWVKMEVKDRFNQTSIDSIWLETYGSIKDTSHFLDPRDGQVYKTVRLFGLTWMAENLNYGKMINVTDTVNDNSIVEKYCFQNDSNQRVDQGGALTFYDFMEIVNHDTSLLTDICPVGWELPSKADWSLITESIDRPMYYFASGGFSNLNLTRTGFHPLLKDWNEFPFSIKNSHWTYFTGSFYHGYLNGPDKIIPYVASSKQVNNRGYVYSFQFYSTTIRKHGGIAPVRCIKRD